MIEVTVVATTYTVCALPETHPWHYQYAITVEYRGADAWAVTRSGWCLGLDGRWEFTPRPSEQDDDWLTTHRFPLSRALELAEDAAPKIRVNHLGVAQAIALHQAGKAR